MYITHLEFSISPFPASMPNPKALSLHTIASLSIGCASDIIGYLDKLSLVDGIQADWDSFEHDETTRRGSVRVVLGRPTTRKQVSLASWSYEPLDDPDNAEPLPIPVDYRTETVGVLTPAQLEKFWNRVNDEVEPFQVLDAVLERFGLTPSEHDEADVFTLRQVLALDWYRNFPTLEAGERALDVEPDLTDVVLGQVTLMASRCGLEGEAYELFGVFVISDR